MEKVRNFYPYGNSLYYNTFLRDIQINNNGKEKNKSKLCTINNREENLLGNKCILKIRKSNNQRFMYKKLIMFDYDDTILPTSWITVHMKLNLSDAIPIYIKQLFSKLSDVVINTLNLCLNQGILIIVTNASLEWLVNSAKKFIPAVWNFIIQNNVRIISARDRLFNSQIEPKDWKKVIFHQIINEILAPYLYNASFICFIYSVGDGNDERNACFFISQLNQYSSCIFKSLKFLSEPTCQKLIAEHELFYYFFNSTNSITNMDNIASAKNASNNIKGYNTKNMNIENNYNSNINFVFNNNIFNKNFNCIKSI